MFRSLIIIAALIMVYLLVKNRLQQRQLNKTQKTTRANTVQCMQCEIYIPDNEAVSIDKQHFCCKQHLRDWQASHNKP